MDRLGTEYTKTVSSKYNMVWVQDFRTEGSGYVKPLSAMYLHTNTQRLSSFLVFSQPRNRGGPKPRGFEVKLYLGKEIADLGKCRISRIV